ncbi:MAG: hypothetical protein HOK41_16685 [Nitrospina sp.]|jgi:hypothetical protein|nr:hypothetical protein [Nitrospina sp.]MBT6718442.1 hypothetical protein [Nitrospina sp.]
MSVGKEQINKIYIWLAIGFILMLPFFYFDYSPKDNVELRKGIAVVRYMSAQRQLQRSSFLVAYPEGTPEQFLDWMFSPMGAAEWPPYEGGLEFSPEEEKMVRKTGMPFIPAGLLLIPHEPDTENGRQVVVSADAETRFLIAEGYESPSDPPVLVKEWAFPEMGGE